MRCVVVFEDWVDKCSLIDFGFKGFIYIYANGREVIDMIKERFDMVMVNLLWL